VAYPTDTCYGLAVDAGNIKAIKRLYLVKGRDFNKPVHIVVPSPAYAKKIAHYNIAAQKLSRKFWPGSVTLILCLKDKDKGLQMLSAKTGSIGLRMPDNLVALDMAKKLGCPITATSANVSGQADCYSAEEIISQFKNQKYKPDIIINAGKLSKRKPSTLVRVFDDVVKVLRQGPISEKQIIKVVSSK
jgi:L-threonylcarbamoyladenylate synthase